MRAEGFLGNPSQRVSDWDEAFPVPWFPLMQHCLDSGSMISVQLLFLPGVGKEELRVLGRLLLPTLPF